MYYFCKQGVLDYTLGQQDPDGDLCSSGRSIIETLEMHAGFECLDVAVYTWEALVRLANMAAAVGDSEVIADLEAKAAALKQLLYDEWWLEDEGLFADVRASPGNVRRVLTHLDELALTNPAFHVVEQTQQAHRLLDPLLTAKGGLTQDADLPWLLRHWIVLCPVEVGLATPEQAQQTFSRLASPEFSGEWGLRLHPNNPYSMSISTGMMALAEARYGQLEQALALIKRLTESRNLRMPGAISEALPDLWCFLQLWSAVGVIAPVVEVLLGLEPRAGERLLRVIPNLPPLWDQAELSHVRVGDAHFEVIAERHPGQHSVTVRSDACNYNLELGCYIPAEVEVEAQLNGQPVVGTTELTLSGRRFVCRTHNEGQLIVTFPEKICQN